MKLGVMLDYAVTGSERSDLRDHVLFGFVATTLSPTVIRAGGGPLQTPSEPEAPLISRRC